MRAAAVLGGTERACVRLAGACICTANFRASSSGAASRCQGNCRCAVGRVWPLFDHSVREREQRSRRFRGHRDRFSSFERHREGWGGFRSYNSPKLSYYYAEMQGNDLAKLCSTWYDRKRFCNEVTTSFDHSTLNEVSGSSNGMSFFISRDDNDWTGDL